MDLSGIPGVKDLTLVSLGKHCHSTLETLILTGCPSVTYDGIVHFLLNSPSNLKSINLSHCSSLYSSPLCHYSIFGSFENCLIDQKGLARILNDLNQTSVFEAKLLNEYQFGLNHGSSQFGAGKGGINMGMKQDISHFQSTGDALSKHGLDQILLQGPDPSSLGPIHHGGSFPFTLDTEYEPAQGLLFTDSIGFGTESIQRDKFNLTPHLSLSGPFESGSWKSWKEKSQKPVKSNEFWKGEFSRDDGTLLMYEPPTPPLSPKQGPTGKNLNTITSCLRESLRESQIALDEIKTPFLSSLLTKEMYYIKVDSELFLIDKSSGQTELIPLKKVKIGFLSPFLFSLCFLPPTSKFFPTRSLFFVFFSHPIFKYPTQGTLQRKFQNIVKEKILPSNAKVNLFKEEEEKAKGEEEDISTHFRFQIFRFQVKLFPLGLLLLPLSSPPSQSGFLDP